MNIEAPYILDTWEFDGASLCEDGCPVREFCQIQIPTSNPGHLLGVIHKDCLHFPKAAAQMDAQAESVKAP